MPRKRRKNRRPRWYRRGEIIYQQLVRQNDCRYAENVLALRDRIKRGEPV